MAGVKIKDRWTAEQDDLIISLRGERRPWSEVARLAGRSVEAVTSRYRVLVPEAKRIRYQSLRHWSDEDKATLARMLEEKKSKREIAATLGRTVSMVHSMIYYQRCYNVRDIHLERVPRVHVPEDREEDRRRRMEAPRDLTAEFFGDPPFSQSALAKKQGAFA